MAAEYSDTEAFRGASFTGADLTGAKFRDCDLRQVRIVDSWLIDVQVSGEVGSFVVNDVDVTEFVTAELDRRNPERVLVRSMQTADDYQQPTERPISPVRPISFRRVHRHRGKFADSYGVLFILGMLFIAISLGCTIAICFNRGWRWQGFCLVGRALALDLCGCLSGIIGCLPWNWWGCLHDGQEHSQRNYLHSGEIVSCPHASR